jgi:3-isopropylmalate/(R)-2-methylmalate dehydratase small subunit
VIGSTFGDIFYNNSINHGLLLIKQDEDVCKQLRDQLHATPGTTMSVDLPNQSFMGPDGQRYSFTIEESRKKRLLDGLDEIGLTLEYVAQMNAFETDFRKKHPWLFRPSTSST